MTRVAVASRSFSRHPVLRAELAARHRATFNERGEVLAGEALARFLRGHDAAIVGLERIDGAVLDAAPELRRVSKYGVGTDAIDVEALRARDVALVVTPGVNSRSVAELAVAMMTWLTHRVPEAIAGAAARGRLLSGRTVGIVGLGHVGQAVGALLRPYGCRILAHDIADRSAACAALGAEPTGLAALLEASDVVTLHVPLDASTRGLIGAAALARLPRGAVLVNTARAGIVDLAALRLRLASGALAGAALDTDDAAALRDLPTVVATPHIGAATEEAVLAMGRAAIAGLEGAP